MTHVDDRTAEHTIHIDAQPETVWRFFTDPERLLRWWGQAEVDARPGGTIRVSMHEGPRPIMRGEFIELVPYQRIVFTFGWEATLGAPDLPPGSSRVEVTLTGHGGGTQLTLRHSGLPPMLAGETTDGWVHVLNRLAAVAHGQRSVVTR